WLWHMEHCFRTGFKEKQLWCTRKSGIPVSCQALHPVTGQLSDNQTSQGAHWNPSAWDDGHDRDRQRPNAGRRFDKANNASMEVYQAKYSLHDVSIKLINCSEKSI